MVTMTTVFNKNMRQFGVAHEIKNPFFSDEEKLGHHFDLPPFFNYMSKQFLTECVQVSAMLTLGLQGAGSEAPKA